MISRSELIPKLLTFNEFCGTSRSEVLGNWRSAMAKCHKKMCKFLWIEGNFNPRSRCPNNHRLL